MKIFSSLLIPLILFAAEFRVANYNVENLFDITLNGNEYREYKPDNRYQWNKRVYKIKLEHISKVIRDLKADIIGLEEIENRNALKDLIKTLNKMGVKYPYFAIADKKKTTIKCAILSKYPIIKKREVIVGNRYSKYRNILEVVVKIEDKNLTLFVNHWKSKAGAESKRVVYATALKKRIDQLQGKEFILLGDFNSNYNEYKTFKGRVKLNNTNGKTGINHILKTIKNQKLIRKEEIKEQNNSQYLYNLWLELPEEERYSHIFYNKKGTLDNILLPHTLFNNRDIEYIDNSFNKFAPNYLLDKKGRPIRWKITNRGRGKHKGEGYSDHLPIYADFKIEE